MLTIGIKIEKGYDAFEKGKAMDVFMQNANGRYVVGKVWPGYALV